jgi:hypothetical protein
MTLISATPTVAGMITTGMRLGHESQANNPSIRLANRLLANCAKNYTYFPGISMIWEILNLLMSYFY